MKTLTIVLTDGPYISEYAEMAYKIAQVALKEHQVNIFLIPGCGAHAQARSYY